MSLTQPELLASGVVFAGVGVVLHAANVNAKVRTGKSALLFLEPTIGWITDRISGCPLTETAPRSVSGPDMPQSSQEPGPSALSPRRSAFDVDDAIHAAPSAGWKSLSYPP